MCVCVFFEQMWMSMRGFSVCVLNEIARASSQSNLH